MNSKTRAVTVTIVSLLLFAASFWIGGYDFDHRGPDVAWGFITAITLSLTAGLFSF